jgi:S-sulfosulfanyl-L-cysteine sulfohydrolase
LHQELFWNGSSPQHQLVGGYSRIAQLMEDVYHENPERVIALDCGDTFHGTYPVVKSQGMVMVPILKEIGFQAMTGHWEFAYGPKQFIKITKKLNYPMLAINCYQEKNDSLVFPPYTIQEVGDLKIGIIGIAATIVDKVMPPHFSQGMYFTLGRSELPEYIRKLREDERVDLVVVISHLGFPQEFKLAQEVEGMDVLLSAHTHNRLYHPVKVNETIIIQSGCHGSFMGRLDIEIQDRMIKSYQHQLITISKDIKPQPEIEELVKNALDPHREMLSEVVGETETSLNRNTILESTMDNFLLKSIMKETGSQVAFSNGWRYGAPIPLGPVTVEDLWNIIPVNPPVSTVELSGREIWEMLELNAELTFSRDPYQQMGGYLKRFMGLNLYLKVENPPGERVQEIFIQGKPLNPDTVYQTTFVTSQGVPEIYGKNRKESEVKAVEALKKYISTKKKISAELSGSTLLV